MELVLADVRWLLMKELGPLPKATPDKPERPSDLLLFFQVLLPKRNHVIWHQCHDGV